MMHLKYGRNCLFFCFHCGLIKSAVISTWGESYLKLNITRNAIAALTPFSSVFGPLYHNYGDKHHWFLSVYSLQKSSNEIFIATPKWVSLTSGERGRFFFFFLPWTYGNLSSILWQLYFSKDRNRQKQQLLHEMDKSGGFSLTFQL